MALGSVFGGVGACAASLEVSPLLLEVPPGTNIATYRLRNSSDVEVGVQVTAYSWKQSDTNDEMTPAENLMIVPAIVSVPAGQEQLVRVALRAERPDRELSYRVHFQELPARSQEGAVVVQTLLRLNVPLFFVSSSGKRTYEAQLVADNESEMAVVIANTGSRFLRVSQLTLRSADGKVIAAKSGPLYVLPGATRKWLLESKKDVNRGGAAAQSEQVFQLQVSHSGGTDDHSVEVR